MQILLHRRRQRGAVIVTVSLVLLFLLGFMGIALDLGRLFIVKSELQTAMDSCALAAAQELDGQSTALTRAASAGQTAGNTNNVNLQSSTWSGQGKIIDADISFKDAFYLTTTIAANARYAQCRHTQSGIGMWLLQSMSAFSGDSADYPKTQNVMALSVATRASAQTTCPIPVAFKFKSGTSSPNYGLQVGQWITVLGNATPGAGEFGWYNLDGSSNPREIKDQMEDGTCGVKVGDQLGTPTTKNSVDTVWNYRFGIYKNTGDPSVNHPDFSGYAYTSNNWKNASPQNAWSGTPAAGSDPTAVNFLTKRATFASFDDTGTDPKDGSLIVYGDRNKLSSFKNLATPGNAGQHQQYGLDRRIVIIPVINSANRVMDYLCMFMLQPLSSPNDDVQLEFRGNAGAASSACTSNGLAGGTAGPLVPVLVR